MASTATIADFRTLLSHQTREQCRNIGRAIARVQGEAAKVGALGGNRVYFLYLDELERAWNESAGFMLRELRRWSRQTKLDRQELREATAAELHRLHSALLEASKIQQPVSGGYAQSEAPADVTDRVGTLSADIEFRLRQFDINMDADDGASGSPGWPRRAMLWLGNHIFATILTILATVIAAVLIARFGLSAPDRTEPQDEAGDFNLAFPSNSPSPVDPPISTNESAPATVPTQVRVDERAPEKQRDETASSEQQPVTDPSPQELPRNPSLGCPTSVITLTFDPEPARNSRTFIRVRLAQGVTSVRISNCEASGSFRTGAQDDRYSRSGYISPANIQIAFAYYHAGVVECSVSGTAAGPRAYRGSLRCENSEGSGVSIPEVDIRL